MSKNTSLAIQVEPWTSSFSMDWYVTWDDLPEDWAIMALNNMVYLPGSHETHFLNNVAMTFPRKSPIERTTTFEMCTDDEGRLVAFDSLDAARKYIFQQMGTAQ